MAQPRGPYGAYRKVQTNYRKMKYDAAGHIPGARSVGNFRAAHPVAFGAATNTVTGAAIGASTGGLATKSWSGAGKGAVAGGAIGVAKNAATGAVMGSGSQRYKYGKVRSAQRFRQGKFGVPDSHEKLFHKSNYHNHMSGGSGAF